MENQYLPYLIYFVGIWIFIAMLRKAYDGENLTVKIGKRSTRSELKFGEWFGDKGGKIAIIIYGVLMLALFIGLGMFYQSRI